MDPLVTSPGMLTASEAAILKSAARGEPFLPRDERSFQTVFNEGRYQELFSAAYFSDILHGQQVQEDYNSHPAKVRSCLVLVLNELDTPLALASPPDPGSGELTGRPADEREPAFEHGCHGLIPGLREGCPGLGIIGYRRAVGFSGIEFGLTFAPCSYLPDGMALACGIPYDSTSPARIGLLLRADRETAIREIGRSPGGTTASIESSGRETNGAGLPATVRVDASIQRPTKDPSYIIYASISAKTVKQTS